MQSVKLCTQQNYVPNLRMSFGFIFLYQEGNRQNHFLSCRFSEYSLPYFSRFSNILVYPTIIQCSFLLANFYFYYNSGPQIVKLTISASEILTNRKFQSIESSTSSPLLFSITFFLSKKTPYPTPQSFTVRLPLSIFSYILKLLLVIAIGVCSHSFVVPKITFYPYLILMPRVPLAPVRSTQVQSSEIDVRSGLGSEST